MRTLLPVAFRVRAISAFPDADGHQQTRLYKATTGKRQREADCYIGSITSVSLTMLSSSSEVAQWYFFSLWRYNWLAFQPAVCDIVGLESPSWAVCVYHFYLVKLFKNLVEPCFVQNLYDRHLSTNINGKAPIRRAYLVGAQKFKTAVVFCQGFLQSASSNLHVQQYFCPALV